MLVYLKRLAACLKIAFVISSNVIPLSSPLQFAAELIITEHANQHQSEKHKRHWHKIRQFKIITNLITE